MSFYFPYSKFQNLKISHPGHREKVLRQGGAKRQFYPSPSTSEPQMRHDVRAPPCSWGAVLFYWKRGCWAGHRGTWPRCPPPAEAPACSSSDPTQQNHLPLFHNPAGRLGFSFRTPRTLVESAMATFNGLYGLLTVRTPLTQLPSD